MSQVIEIGGSVTCSYRDDHIGTVMRVDDVRAWAGTIEFGLKPLPSQLAVTAHVVRCYLMGLLTNKVPVMYTFGIRWDRLDSLESA